LLSHGLTGKGEIQGAPQNGAPHFFIHQALDKNNKTLHIK